ncbi:DUF721 domain-containing protein [Rhodobacteraceae bacterium NNCM2]|nr:DUF721 domain-containing protein [Coraliihabitans acroporae]
MAKGDAKSDEARSARDRGRPFHRPSQTIRHRLKSIAASKGFAEPDVLIRWPEAVGPELSGICQPVKVSYGGSFGATLIVFADGARAIEVEHRAPQIVDRINSFYGYRAIARLKITQATGRRVAARGFAEARTTFDGPPAEQRLPSAENADKAAALASGIQNADLRAALTKMGAWVLSRSASQSSGKEKKT